MNMIMAKRILVILYISLLALQAFCGPAIFSTTRRSGGLFGHDNARFVKAAAQRRTVPTADTLHLAATSATADTASYALYMNCVKQHGWIRGLGKPISDEHARHLSSYYRFSNKNRAGHWTKVENFNSYGQLSNGQMGTYLLNPFDDSDTSIDSKWRDKLKQVVCWELVGDASGENCIQENAYDSDHNLIYSYIPVQIAPDCYMGHYVDAWGMPARFRDENGARYVVIRLDENGYESEISFIGEDGFPKKNMWNSYMSKYRFDRYGFKLSERSCSVEGNYMRDRSDNSGQNCINDEYGNTVLVTNFDENNHCVRIGGDEDWIQYKSEFDEWGRIIRRIYQLPDGTPDTTRNGVHGYELKYDDHGNQTHIQNIGLDGSPVNFAPGMHSLIRQDYDRWGNNTLLELRDRDNLLWNNADGYCMVICAFDGSKLLTQKNYATTDGRDTVTVYDFYRDGNKRINIYYNRNEIDVYTDDDDGNPIEEAYYTLDWKPRIDEFRGYHRKVLDKTRGDGIYREEISMYDTEGNYVSLKNETFRRYMTDNFSTVYNRFILVTDSANLISTRKIYDGNTLFLSYEQPQSQDLEMAMGEIGIDITGERARTHYEQALYYKAHTGNTIKGEYAYIGITNEYGEIAYAQENDRAFSTAYAFRTIGNTEKDLDEDGNPISNPDTFNRRLPRAYVIEVADSNAVALGIRSGDIIMKYGNLSCPKPQHSYSYGGNLRQMMFLYRDTDKKMTVMRRNPDTNSAEAVTIQLGKGMPRDYGFYIYAIPYTRQESERYTACYKAGVHADDPKLEKYVSKRDAQLIFFWPARIQGHQKNVFSRGFHHDAILLGAVVQDSLGVCRSAVCNSGIAAMEKCWLANGMPVKKIWFTDDLKTVHSLEIRNPGEFWDVIYRNEDMADRKLAKACQGLCRLTEKEMTLYMDDLRREHTDSLVSRYGDAYRAVVNDSIYVVGALVLTDEKRGYMAEQGYTGNFIVLEWCGWKCTDSMADYRAVFDKNRKKKKHLVLLPLLTDEEGNSVFGEIITVDSTSPTVGLQLKTLPFSYTLVREEILDRYDAWRRSRQQ